MMGETAPELVAYSETADAREARAYLARVRQRPELKGVDVETLALCGATARAIVDAVGAFHADSIVMSSHGRSGVTRWMLGSVAEHVVRHADVPVLVLRGDQALIQAPAEGAVWRACVGLDGSALAEQAVAPTAQLLRALAGSAPVELLLTRVMKPPIPPDDELASIVQETAAAYERRVAEAQANLEAVAARLRSGDLARYAARPRWAVVQAVDAAEALIQAAEHPERAQWRPTDGEESPAGPAQPAPAHLIAVATHGRGGFQRWALGSVAERVLEGTALPLLLVRAVAAPAGAAPAPGGPAKVGV
jgi:nucleotide-binding universal stress UspA family protein